MPWCPAGPRCYQATAVKAVVAGTAAHPVPAVVPLVAPPAVMAVLRLSLPTVGLYEACVAPPARQRHCAHGAVAAGVQAASVVHMLG